MDVENRRRYQPVLPVTCRNASLAYAHERKGVRRDIEHNSDFYSCGHFVDEEHRLGNVRQTPLSIVSSPVDLDLEAKLPIR